MTRTRIGLLLAIVALGGCGGAREAVQLPATAANQRPPLAEVDIVDIALLVKLEDTRQFDEVALARLLQSKHPEVKRRAVVAVGRIADPRGGVLLQPLRRDENPEIVATVAFATGQLKDPAGVAWLAQMLLANPNTGVAFEAARGLGKIRTPEAWKALAQYLTNATRGAATEGVVGEALLSMGRYTTREDLAPIVKWTTPTTSPEVRWRAAWALFRPRNPAAVPHLLKLSEDASPDVRFWAMRGLALPPAPTSTPPPGTAPPVEPAAVVVDRAATAARLRAGTKDTDRRVRTEALRALDGYDDEESFGVVLAALEDPDTWLSVSAAELLGRHKGRVGQVAPRLAAATASSKPAALRLTAFTPLTQLAPPLALDAAATLLRDPSLAIRTSATQALRRMGPIGQQFLDQLATDPTMKDLLIPAAPAGGGRQGGAAAPAQPVPARTDADYRAIVERWIVPAYNGAPAPRAVWNTPKGEIELELYPGESPLGMEEFVRLTESGAIVGTVFSRVVPNFVAQQATIRGANRLRDEVSRLGLTRGNLAWASSGLDTGRAGYTLGSTPQPHNEGDFTALGRVVRGMDVVDHLDMGDAVTAARMVR
ncbi:MAG TPA: HEAT repeat domain-containing protein [Vicinamibacterales bacterium]|nr:HEAT repeat domain-containing protein [Vicinamibacterales bacterium]